MDNNHSMSIGGQSQSVSGGSSCYTGHPIQSHPISSYLQQHMFHDSHQTSLHSSSIPDSSYLHPHSPSYLTHLQQSLHTLTTAHSHLLTLYSQKQQQLKLLQLKLVEKEISQRQMVNQISLLKGELQAQKAKRGVWEEFGGKVLGHGGFKGTGSLSDKQGEGNTNNNENIQRNTNETTMINTNYNIQHLTTIQSTNITFSYQPLPPPPVPPATPIPSSTSHLLITISQLKSELKAKTNQYSQLLSRMVQCQNAIGLGQELLKRNQQLEEEFRKLRAELREVKLNMKISNRNESDDGGSNSLYGNNKYNQASHKNINQTITIHPNTDHTLPNQIPPSIQTDPKIQKQLPVIQQLQLIYCILLENQCLHQFMEQLYGQQQYRDRIEQEMARMKDDSRNRVARCRYASFEEMVKVQQILRMKVRG